jgi:hypothetical protein
MSVRRLAFLTSPYKGEVDRAAVGWESFVGLTPSLTLPLSGGGSLLNPLIKSQLIGAVS